MEQGHESGLVKVCVLIKDRALCSYHQGLGGKDDFWAEERRTSDFVIPNVISWEKSFCLENLTIEIGRASCRERV